MTSRSAILLLVFVATGLPFAAGAEPTDLLREGIRLNGRGDYGQSLEVLERAAQTSANPKRLGQIYLYIGFNRAVLRDREGAERALRVALENDPDLEPDPRRFKRALLDLFRSVRAQLGLLVVTADREGAALTLDGTNRGILPVRLRLPAGSYPLEVRLGPVVQRQTATLSTGQSLTLRIVFAEAASRPSVAVQPAALPSPAPRPRPAPPSFWQRRRVWTWVAAGTAVATLAVALGLEISTNGDEQKWSDARNQYTREPTGANLTNLTQLKDSLNTRWTAASILYGVTGGLVLTSAVLLFLEGRFQAESADPVASPRVSILPLAGGAGAILTGRFE
jgi:tetratricopeptide (TPR) repeat protein